MDAEVAKTYGNKVRVRVCGICWEADRLLMVNHTGITPTNFWAPPGGGVEFGQSIADTLKREFREETGLRVTPGQFLFGCEYIQDPIHSIELFYDIPANSGQMKTGNDPELQIISDVRFFSIPEIMALPDEELHGIFRIVNSPADLKSLSGFFSI